MAVGRAYGQTDLTWLSASASVSEPFRRNRLFRGDVRLDERIYMQNLFVSPCVERSIVDKVFDRGADFYYFNLHGSDAPTACSFYASYQQQCYEAVTPRQLASAEKPNVVVYFTDPENTKITITDGKDGAAAPVIGVAKDTDEIYYWTLTSGEGEPEWLLADGKKIPVTAAAVVPLLKIDDKGFWIISCDKGATWNYITDDKDQPVSPPCGRRPRRGLRRRAGRRSRAAHMRRRS